MGASLSCPNGFQQGAPFSCQANCPSEFKNTVGQCVHVTRNRGFALTRLPMLQPGSPVPTTFQEEQKRVQAEAAKIREEIRATDEIEKVRNQNVQEYSRIQTEAANYNESVSAVRELRDVKDSLKPFRPPTAPSSDLEKERKAITDVARRNLYFLQIALFLVVLVLLSYITLPLEYANAISFLLLCMGIALGFFLKG
jgi:cation transport ATPase